MPYRARPGDRAARRTHLRAPLCALFHWAVCPRFCVKGRNHPRCIDLDLQLYLHDTAYLAPGQLPLSLGLAIHAELALIDPAPFSAIQCFAFPPRPRSDYVGPIPGAYAVIAGRLPVPEASEAALRAAAIRALAAPNLVVPYIAETLLQHGGWELKRRVRHICTDVWPALYHVLTLQQQDGIRIWGLPKAAAMDLLPPTSSLSVTIQRFYQAVHAYYPAAVSTSHALQVIEYGSHFLHAAQDWWQQAGQTAD